jgi:hypothetical protein
MKKFNDPILIVSAPRSGSSLLAYILNKEGIQVGITKAGDKYNVNGYFENIRIRNLMIKYLKENDKQKLGKKFQPINIRSDFKNFNRKMYRVLRQDKFDKNKNWLIKDPKLTLCWNIFNKEYPNAKWILLYRNQNDIMSSYKKTEFMDAYNTEDDWKKYLNCFYENMNSIKLECKNVFEFDIKNIFENNINEINKLFEFIGIKNTNKYIECVDKELFTINK